MIKRFLSTAKKARNTIGQTRDGQTEICVVTGLTVTGLNEICVVTGLTASGLTDVVLYHLLAK